MTLQPGESPDLHLLKNAVRGDANAYGEIYDRYVDAVYQYIFYRVGEQQDAEDLTETVFLKAWESLRNNGTAVQNVKAWLYRMAHNIVIDHYRTRKMNLSLDQVEAWSENEPLPELAVQEREKAVILSRAIRQLEHHFQQVIVCRFINGLSHQETAQVTGIPESYLRVIQYRALAKLKQLLERNALREE
ncbi:MAG TPA: sigma-70 family RNA polymerase sigma factor [Anaerolineaceae bacterium]|nr:sigma-70 family RNA polymerase sigma factor [Anaerolineaceae bacterium]